MIRTVFAAATSLAHFTPGYTHLIAQQIAAIAFVRVGALVIGSDYIQSQPPVDLGKAADLTRAAVAKAIAAR
jgi:hypothetical protein